MISLDKLQTEVKRQKRKISEIEKEIERVEKEFNADFDDERKEIKEQRDLADDPGLQIAIVGTIKAGKSTFINALFRENIASTEVTPETASLTKFIYSHENKLVVKFYNKNDWDKLWKSVEDSEKGTKTSISREEVKEEQMEKIKKLIFREEFESSGAKNVERDYIGSSDKIIEVANFEELKSKVKDYTSKQSKIHYFVKELIVYLNNEYMPENVTIVDTPGLDDVVDYRSNITRDYIKRANAVIVCFDAHKSLSNQEYSTIFEVFENVGDEKFKVIILGTQLDRCNSKSDWEKVSEGAKQILKHNYKSEDLLESNVIGVSSKVFSDIIELEKTGNYEEKDITKNIYYFAKDYGIELSKSQDKNDIIHNFDRIKSLTNIEKVYSLIKNTILSKGAEIAKNDLETRFSNMITNISNKAKSIKEGNNQSRATLDMDAKQQEDFELQKNKEIEEIETAMEELNENFEKIEEEWLNKNKQIKEAIKQ